MQPTPMITVGLTSTSDDDNLNYGGTAQVDLQLAPSHYAIVGVYTLMDDLDSDKSTITRTAIGPRPPTTQTERRRDRASLKTVSAFLQDEWSITPEFKLTGGARWYHVTSGLDESSEEIRPDQGSRTTANWVTSLGSTWAVGEGTTLRALYSEGYIMPTLLQLFTDSAAGRGTLTYGNPNLAPETSRNLELGARYQHQGLQLDLAIYHTRADSFITSQECGAGSRGQCPGAAVPGSFVYVNADRATSRGVELMAEYALQDSAFALYGSAAWAQRRLELALVQQDFADSSLPRLTSRVGVRYDDIFARHDVWADLFVRAATHSQQILVADGAHTHAQHGQYFPGWGTVNLSTGIALGAERRQKLGLHLENLFDRSYRTSVDELPALGRSAVATFQLAF
jgi:hemoglobin/transferrin/lactoferrin receptor protein